MIIFEIITYITGTWNCPTVKKYVKIHIFILKSKEEVLQFCIGNSNVSKTRCTVMSVNLTFTSTIIYLMSRSLVIRRRQFTNALGGWWRDYMAWFASGKRTCQPVQRTCEIIGNRNSHCAWVGRTSYYLRYLLLDDCRCAIKLWLRVTSYVHVRNTPISSYLLVVISS